MYSEDIIEEIMTQVGFWVTICVLEKSKSVPIRSVWHWVRKSISDSDLDLYIFYSHPSFNQSAQPKHESFIKQGTALGKEIDPNNPWNMTGKEFDPTKSGVSAENSTWLRMGPDWWRKHHCQWWCLWIICTMDLDSMSHCLHPIEMNWKRIGCIWLNWLQVLSAIMEREPEAQPAHHHLPWEKPPIVRFSPGRSNNLPWENPPLWEEAVHHQPLYTEKLKNCPKETKIYAACSPFSIYTLQIIWKCMHLILDFYGWFLPLIHKMRPREPKE